PPTRYWESMLPIKWGEGIKYETTWVNDGPESVGFGLTSADEMMVMMYFFVDDTTGLNLPMALSNHELEKNAINLFPNPASDKVYITSDINLSGATITIADISGKIIKTELTESISTGLNYYQVDISNLIPGIYLMNIIDKSGNISSRKVVVE
ncbi:MAG: T9SS type A sorting domain-containing protein, partial [Chitinophagales bacterium]